MDFYKVKFFNLDGTLDSIEHVKADDVLRFEEFDGKTLVILRRYHTGLKRSKVFFFCFKTVNTVQQILDTKEITIKFDK